MPKVSILTPARNEEKSIGKLIDRINNAGIPVDYEIVVVDDSDNNATALMALAKGARVIGGRHKGLAQAVVDGVEATDSEYIVVMDSDCLPPGTAIYVPKVKHCPGRFCKVSKKNCVPYSVSYIGVQNIEKFKIGDIVLSYNERTGRKEWDEVSGLFHRCDKRLLNLKFSNGNELSLTGNHPIYVHGKGWVKVDDIEVGDQVIQCKSNSLSFRIRNLSKRGRTLEEIYGLTKAIAIKKNMIDVAIESNKLHKEKISEGHKRAWENKNSKYHTSIKFKEHVASATLQLNEFNRRQKGKTYEQRYGEDTAKRLRELRAKNIINSNSPNKSEMRLGNIIEEICPGEFKYNGCCELGVVVGHHVPDFWNVNGKKKVIELFGEPWHKADEEEKYKSDYKECGVDCLVIWYEELRNREIVEQKILDFVYNPNAIVVKVIGKEVIFSEKGFDTYNLETKKNHNFFAYGILVHNCQHPPELLPKVIEGLDQHDLVVVTKHSKEATDGLSLWRKVQSNLAVFSAHMFVPAPVSDPMAGYFGVRRECLEGVELNAIGFKIGLEIFAKAKWVSHCEIPMVFAEREAGESKGTAHSLHKHLWKLFQDTLSTEIVLPKGSEEYYAFYESADRQKKWKQSIAELLKARVQEISPKRLLDAGCGSSPNINIISADNKMGMDINEQALEYMRTHSDARFAVGSVLEIPFLDNSFDCVLCIEVLEHLYPEEVDKAISEINRVLVSGGHAIIATPNYSSLLWNLIEKTQKLIQPREWTSDHHTQLNHRLLSKLCLRQGLHETKYDSVMRNMDMVITYQKI